MEHNCERHTFEVAEGECRSCLGSFCLDCLIYPFGADQPPYCKPCALTAGGIRSTARNPRRTEKVAEKAAATSGGLLSRFHRGDRRGHKPVELTPEQRIEAEAEEARRMLDAQRLPTAVEEEPEPEPTPTPNIAPPATADVASELTHRSLPDSVAGGLDLGGDGGADDARATSPDPTTDDDDRPSWARPDAAEPPPANDRQPESPAAPVDAAAVAPPASAGIDGPAVTADGNALFATPVEAAPASTPSPREPAPGEQQEPDDPSAPPAPPRSDRESSPLTSSLADMVEDSDELLRRIADLKGA